MSRRSRRTGARRGARASARTEEDRYYVHVADKWGLDKPLSVFRVRGEGGAVGEEEVAPGVVSRLSRSMPRRVPMLAGPGGFLRWWVGLGESP